jgi:hypothetical protein
MATKKICDRCGAEINPIDSGKRIAIYALESFEKQGVTELCVSCVFHLRK